MGQGAEDSVSPSPRRWKVLIVDDVQDLRDSIRYLLEGEGYEVLEASDGRLVVVGTPEPPSHHHPRHDHAH